MPTQTASRRKRPRSRKGQPKRKKSAVRASEPQSVELGGKRYVIVEAEQYDRLRVMAGELTEQDLGDIAESIRREHEESIPLEQVLKRYGL